jgi:hypothetical protein
MRVATKRMKATKATKKTRTGTMKNSSASCGPVY